MRVLITNIVLTGRTGTEMFVRDLALGLTRRGHQPMVWSPSIDEGAVPVDLRTVGVPVLDRLDVRMAEPDVVHGHHHDETLAALSRFPDRPGLFVLHDASAWSDEPPRHPRLLRHLAVDDLCRERLVAGGFPERNIGFLRNGVDTDRFQPRGPLPDRPRRGLIFSHTAREETHVPAVREACDRLGVTLEVVGRGAGSVVARPEEVLTGYDVVFAKGRSALEAAAVGCAVVVIDWLGLGGMLTPDRLAEWRRWNFGRHLLVRPLTAQAIGEELERYDPVGAAAVRDEVRATCSLERMVDTAIAEYEGLQRGWAEMPRPDPRDELEAASHRLALISPLRMAQDALGGERHLRAVAEAAAHQARTDAHHAWTEAQQARVDAQLTRAEVDQARAEAQALAEELDAARTAIEAVQQHLRLVEEERDAALGRAAAADELVEAFRRTRVIRGRDLLMRSPFAPWIRRLSRRGPA